MKRSAIRVAEHHFDGIGDDDLTVNANVSVTGGAGSITLARQNVLQSANTTISSTGGNIALSANANITLTGNAAVSTSSTGTVTLTATAGAITTGNGGLIAGSGLVTLSSGDGDHGDNGGDHVDGEQQPEWKHRHSEHGALTIGGAGISQTGSGTVQVMATGGSLTANQSVTSDGNGTITLSATGNSSDITVANSMTVRALAATSH